MNSADFKPCAICRKGLMHTGLPLFWRVSIERMAVDVRKVREQAGLEMMLGSVPLARVMGNDSNLAKPVHEQPTELLVCEHCAVNQSTVVAHLAEIGS